MRASVLKLLNAIFRYPAFEYVLLLILFCFFIRWWENSYTAVIAIDTLGVFILS